MHYLGRSDRFTLYILTSRGTPQMHVYICMHLYGRSMYKLINPHADAQCDFYVDFFKKSRQGNHSRDDLALLGRLPGPADGVNMTWKMT